MRFDLLSLRLFVAVCEERSIAHAADRERALAAGMDDFMPKPVKLAQLAALRTGSLAWGDSSTLWLRPPLA